MHQPFYNPCDDGFAAKVWECLRRNEKFRDEVESILNAEKSEDDKHWAGMAAAREAESVLNYAAAAVFEQITEIDINSPWPEQPAEFRTSFERIFSDQRDLPGHAYQPQFVGSTPLPFIATDLDPKDPNNLASTLKMILADHVLIAVPKHTRDSGHREEVFKELEQLVESPSLKKIALRPTGKLLGSITGWDAFLIWEHWKDIIPARGTRLGICKLYLSDRNSYHTGAISGFKDLRPEISNFIEDTASRRGAAVEKDYILPIERGIQETFPIFEVFKHKSEKNLSS